MSEELKQKLRDFQGMAVTMRFDDGAIELEAAGDSASAGRLSTGGGTADVVESLPSDTGAVARARLQGGLVRRHRRLVAPYTGEDPTS